MFIIGELINGMYKKIGAAIRQKDKKVIQECALAQLKAGADALDINCGPGSQDPAGDMQWLVESIQEVTEACLSLDSSKPRVIEAGL
ncbi:MAG: dihydropteroate synthase, partial [Candidatus Omnitrophica bacterium]|nr:dihydropteroate synthase [Candidatus Omnitrophota bacterium]